MLVPKLFRWLFFRKSSVQNVFDAARDSNTLYIDVSLDLGAPIEQIKNSSRLDESNLEEFIFNTPKETIIVLYGNQRTRRMKFYDELKAREFLHVFDAGTFKDITEVFNSI